MTRKPVVSEKLPTIIIGEVEHDRLTSLAETAVSSAPASLRRRNIRVPYSSRLNHALDILQLVAAAR
jgi:hypothetical protein